MDQVCFRLTLFWGIRFQIKQEWYEAAINQNKSAQTN